MDAIENLKLEIKKIIIEILDLKVDPSEIDDDDILFDGTLGLDSVATLELISAIEDKWDIEISDEDLNVDLFKDVNSLANYVKNKSG